MRHLFIAEMDKASSKMWIHQNPLVATDELRCDFGKHQKWPAKQKNLISTPGKADKEMLEFLEKFSANKFA